MGTDNIFDALRKFIKGKISERDLMYSDDLIYGVKIKEPLNESIVKLRCGNDNDLLEIINLSNDDIYYVMGVDSPYNPLEVVDIYSARENFENGYGLWSYLNDENMDIVKDISKYILFGQQFNPDKALDLANLGEKLLATFPKMIDDLLYDFMSEVNNSYKEANKEEFAEEINEKVKEKGFNFYPFYALETTVIELIKAYFNTALIDDDLETLLKTIFKDTEYNLSEYYYEVNYEKFLDHDSINYSAKKVFESILETLEEKYEEGKSKEFLDMVIRISNKFKLNTDYKLPKDKRFVFNILDFDPEEEKINVRLYKPNKDFKDISISETNFYNLLYQPELFNLEDL